MAITKAKLNHGIKKTNVVPSITLSVSRRRQQLALVATGRAALVLAGAFGIGLLVWAVILLLKVVT